MSAPPPSTERDQRNAKRWREDVPHKPCPYCAGRGWVVGGDEVRDCYCRGLLATDLTADNSALRGRRDALRAVEAAEDALDASAKVWARHELGLD